MRSHADVGRPHPRAQSSADAGRCAGFPVEEDDPDPAVGHLRKPGELELGNPTHGAQRTSAWGCRLSPRVAVRAARGRAGRSGALAAIRQRISLLTGDKAHPAKGAHLCVDRYIVSADLVPGGRSTLPRSVATPHAATPRSTG